MYYAVNCNMYYPVNRNMEADGVDPAREYEGFIKSFNEIRGFGFIECIALQEQQLIYNLRTMGKHKCMFKPHKTKNHKQKCPALQELFSRDVFIPQSQFEGHRVGERVRFRVQVKKGQPQAGAHSQARAL